MIPTGSVLQLVGLDAIVVCIRHDVDFAVALNLVADRPALHFRPPRRSADNVNLRGKRAFPSALPVRVGRHGSAAREQGQHDD